MWAQLVMDDKSQSFVYSFDILLDVPWSLNNYEL